MDPNVEEENGRRCGCCCCLKYCVFFLLTFLTWIGGVVLLAIGIYYFVGLQHLQEATGFSIMNISGVKAVMMWPAIYFIVVGSLRFIACFIGCCGSIRGSTCLLKSFLIVLTVVFIIELIVEISLAVLYFTAQDYLRENFSGVLTSWTHTYEPAAAEQLLDKLQLKLKCCGANSYRDYDDNNIYNCSSATPNENTCGVPDSCCISYLPGCGRGTRNSDSTAAAMIYDKGCVEAGMSALHSQNNILIIGLVLLGVMLVMLFTIIFGFCVLRQVSNREGSEGTDVRMDLLKSEREYDA